MPLPSQAEIELPLLRALQRAGGSAKPGTIYDDVAAAFPEMTTEEREAELPKWGTNVFNNRVQFARNTLKDRGLIDPSVWGVWTLTPAAEELLAEEDRRAAGVVRAAPARAASLLDLIDDHDRTLRRRLHEYLMAMTPEAFEQFCGQVLRGIGFREVNVTKKTGDGGIDGDGRMRVGIVSVKAGFQCKRWSHTVHRPEIDRVRGAMQGKYDQAIFLTTSGFSNGARAASVSLAAITVVMIDGDKLCDLMIEHGIGVQQRMLSVPVVDEEFFASRTDAGDATG